MTEERASVIMLGIGFSIGSVVSFLFILIPSFADFYNIALGAEVEEVYVSNIKDSSQSGDVVEFRLETKNVIHTYKVNHNALKVGDRLKVYIDSDTSILGLRKSVLGMLFVSIVIFGILSLISFLLLKYNMKIQEKIDKGDWEIGSN